MAFSASTHRIIQTESDESEMLLMRLANEWDHKMLLAQQIFLNTLVKRLADRIISDYNVRRKGIDDDFPASHTFIHSHSSPLHIQQLAILMKSEGMKGWLYVTAKVSAFLFRDDSLPMRSSES